MKRLFSRWMLVFCFAWAGGAAASPCVTAGLAGYVGLGAGGCTIGSFTFSNFMPVSGPTGALDLPPITVVPIVDGPTRIGFDFRTTASATTGILLDQLIGYRVVGVGATVTGATLSFAGTATTGDAAVTAVENLCIGGTFAGVDGVSGCTGSPQVLIVVDTFGAADPPLSVAFAPSALLAVVTDIGVDGGLAGGSGRLSSVGNRFTTSAAATAVPEPETSLLWLVGLVACAGVRRRAARLRSRWA